MLVIFVCLIILLFGVRYCSGLGLLVCIVVFLCVGVFKLILFVLLLLWAGFCLVECIINCFVY